MDVSTLKIQAEGKWHHILSTLGINESFLTGKHGPCPICGGKDRYRFDDKGSKGTFFCNQCQPQAGDGIRLVQKVFGLSFPEAMEKIAYVLSLSLAEAVSLPREVDPRKALRIVSHTSHPLTGSDFVSKYLHGRGLNLTPANVRYCEGCYCKELNLQIPALVATVISHDNKPVTLHRIYLNPDGSRREDIKPDKMLMPAIDDLTGSAIRLFKSDGGKLFIPGVLGVAEGIETAMACAQMFGMVTWSLINSVLMARWTPPKGAKNIVIYGDRDSNFTGQKAAYILANRLHNLGLIVKVKIPKQIGEDWADVLIKEKK